MQIIFRTRRKVLETVTIRGVITKKAQKAANMLLKNDILEFAFKFKEGTTPLMVSESVAGLFTSVVNKKVKPPEYIDKIIFTLKNPKTK